MTEQEINERLIQLYAEIAEHSYCMCSGEHEQGCANPHSCCDPTVCRLVIEEAKWKWDVVLAPTGHPKFPLMNLDGSCSAAPHLRPLCSVHACCISAFGVHPKDHGWTARYWLLRNEIEDLECRKEFGEHDEDVCEEAS